MNKKMDNQYIELSPEINKAVEDYARSHNLSTEEAVSTLFSQGVSTLSESAKKNGTSFSKGVSTLSKMFCVRLSPETARHLAAAANSANRSPANYIRNLIVRHFARKNKN